MVNKRLLESIIVLNGDNKSVLAEAIGICRQGLYDKINCNGKASFNIKEIQTIRDRYNLSLKQICDIFFADN